MNKEILLVVDSVSNERGIDKDVIFEAIEAALATATKKRQRKDIEVRVAINRETGDYDTFRRWQVIGDDEEMEFPDRQITLSDARQQDPAIEIGGFTEEPMESVDFGRIAASTARQVIIQKIREAEKEVVSENMMGIDFRTLLCECRPAVQIMRITEDFGGYEMEFKKGEW